MSLSPQRLMAAVVAAQKATADLPEDERLKADTIEGETELWELVDDYAELALADKALIAKAEERLNRLQKRAERHQDVVRRVLDAVNMQSIQRPLYTAFFTARTHVNVTDEAEVPDQYWRRAVDKIALGKVLRDGQDVPGATLSNGEPSLTLKAT